MKNVKKISSKQYLYFFALQFFLFSQLVFATSGAVEYKPKKKSKRFSLSIRGGLVNVADIAKDGMQDRYFYFPSVHPMMQNVLKVSSNYYTDSLEYSSYINKHRQIKAILPKMLNK
ncbi:MAG: hypothetical protein KC646_17495 [Candidatus Cloacimonetes bacterium]|nr:hypothetical protein [Candidatus Cloacimonadota bacterium]